MTTLIYDGSFEGWLTAVFEAPFYSPKGGNFSERLNNIHIYKEKDVQQHLFGNTHVIYTNETKANRVLKGLKQKLSKEAFQQLYKTFLSEEEGIENIMLQYVQYVYSQKESVENDWSNKAVIAIKQTAKKVNREKHRMEAFVRFQLTKDSLYYAIIQPDFNVLPLIRYHFETRYADQRWLIYDGIRKYGLYYNLNTVETVQISFNNENNNGKDITAIYDEKEDLYQQLWQTYFKSVNIESRKNMHLHIQLMPKRYWKYLVEKKIV